MRLVRCFDGILYSTLAFLALIVPHFAPTWLQQFVHPIGRNALGELDVVCVLPVFAVTWFCYHLPLNVSHATTWTATVVKVRLFAMATAGLMPLAILWMTFPHNAYLLVNSVLAVIAVIALLFHLNLLILTLAVRANDEHIAAEARLTKLLLFYGLLVPYLAIMVTLALESYLSPHGPVDNVLQLLTVAASSGWLTLLTALLFLMLTPVVFTLSLLLRVRPMLAHQLENDLGTFGETYSEWAPRAERADDTFGLS